MKRRSRATRWAVTTGLCACVLGMLLVSAQANSGTGVATCGEDMTIAYAPTTLWPPNNKMSTITITATDTDQEPSGETFSITVVSISSNEDDAAGNSTCGRPSGPDWAGVGNSATGTDDTTAAVTTISLRNERCGIGTGRVYTITLSCADAETPTGTTTLTVAVPHDKGH